MPRLNTEDVSFSQWIFLFYSKHPPQELSLRQAYPVYQLDRLSWCRICNDDKLIKCHRTGSNASAPCQAGAASSAGARMEILACISAFVHRLHVGCSGIHNPVHCYAIDYLRVAFRRQLRLVSECLPPHIVSPSRGDCESTILLQFVTTLHC